MRVKTVLYAVLVFLVGSSALTARGSGASGLSNVPVPARGVYLGAYVDSGPRWEGYAHTVEAITDFERAIGTKLAIDNRFYGWSEPFPTPLQRWDVANGRIPMITWKAPRLDAILNGSQDALIAARAAVLKAFGAPVFIRWGWEMNGPWTQWSGQDNETPGTHDGARKYVAAWRHIHDVFARVGATNVSWVWAPNAQSVPATAWNAIAAYYPGDSYVDWIGFSAYNWGTRRSWSHWTSFAALVAPIYRRWSARKPMMVAETSSTGDAVAKARWIENVSPALERRFPRLKALVWFQEPPNWTVTQPTASLSAFRTLAASPIFTRLPWPDARR